MPARPSVRNLILGTALAAVLAGAARAEDPFLGQIRAIKCVNCKPGWVTLIVHDPIDMRDFELHLKDTDYNKIITPLPGKRIHEKEGSCFYWMEKPKASQTPAAPKPPEGPSAPAGKADAKGARKPLGKAASDSLLAGPGAAASESSDSSLIPPPLAEAQGTPSSCIRFYRQMN